MGCSSGVVQIIPGPGFDWLILLLFNHCLGIAKIRFDNCLSISTMEEISADMGMEGFKKDALTVFNNIENLKVDNLIIVDL